MANKKITELDAQVLPVETGDLIPMVDINDLTQAPTGSTRKVTIDTLATYLDANLSFLSSGDNVSLLTNDAGYLTSFTETDPVFTAHPAFNVTDGGAGTLFLADDGTYKSAGGFGKVGIADSNGEYTYYADLQSAITAASAGNTIELFADITETTDTTITLKDDITINGNGHTYTLNFAATATFALTIPSGATTGVRIYNLNVKRLNGSSTSAAIGGSGANWTLYGDNSVFYNSVGYAIKANNSGSIIYNCTGLANGTNPTIIGGEINNSVGINTSSGSGIQGAILRDCKGKANTGEGIYLNGDGYNCNGFSSGNYGIYCATSSTLHNSTGISNGNTGIEAPQADLYSCVGISSASYGIKSRRNVHNCVGYSTASNGFYCNAGVTNNRVLNSSFTSTSALAVLDTGGHKFFNCSFVCSWNDAGGHGISVNTSSLTEILNCSVEVTNASANCLYSGSATNVKYSNNSFKGSTTAVNANITQGISNTSDSQGNILI